MIGIPLSLEGSRLFLRLVGIGCWVGVITSVKVNCLKHFENKQYH